MERLDCDKDALCGTCSTELKGQGYYIMVFGYEVGPFCWSCGGKVERAAEHESDMVARRIEQEMRADLLAIVGEGT